MEHAADIHIVILEDAILLVKDARADWRAIQEQYDAYKTSFGPWPISDVVEFIEQEWPTLFAEREVAIRAFPTSRETELKL